jgi:hypothetical protein
VTRPFITIKWLDAADYDENWIKDEKVAKFANDPVQVVSGGWLLTETKDYVVLAADDLRENGEQQWGRITKIPKKMVQERCTIPDQSMCLSRANTPGTSAGSSGEPGQTASAGSPPRP